MEIRALDEHDAEAWWRLRLAALEGEPRAFGSSAEEHRATTVEATAARLRSGGNENNFVLGAFVEGQLVGMAGFARDERAKTRHKGRVWGVYVTPNSRGKGIGKAMISEVIRIARSQPGLEQISLIVAIGQPAARRVYASLGFEPFGYESRALKIGEDYIDEEHLVLHFIGAHANP